jgi:hypothetical protein
VAPAGQNPAALLDYIWQLFRALIVYIQFGGSGSPNEKATPNDFKLSLQLVS